MVFFTGKRAKSKRQSKIKISQIHKEKNTGAGARHDSKTAETQTCEITTQTKNKLKGNKSMTQNRDLKLDTTIRNYLSCIVAVVHNVENCAQLSPGESKWIEYNTDAVRVYFYKRLLPNLEMP